MVKLFYILILTTSLQADRSAGFRYNGEISQVMQKKTLQFSYLAGSDKFEETVKIISVKNPDDKTKDFPIRDNTIISENGKSTSFDRLKKGMKLVIEYGVDAECDPQRILTDKIIIINGKN